MQENSELFIGLDVAKNSHDVAVAESCRDGEVRSYGEIGADAASVRRFVRKLDRPNACLRFCYEAGPTGYGLKRQIEAFGHECAMIAPSLIPRRPGERVKTNRRDAMKLARLFRAGELTEIWTPDEAHEAMRDLVRAREAAVSSIRCDGEDGMELDLKDRVRVAGLPVTRKGKSGRLLRRRSHFPDLTVDQLHHADIIFPKRCGDL